MRTPHGGGVLLLSLLCLAAQADSADAPAGSCAVTSLSASHRLRKTLFCNYDRRDRPATDPNNATEIEVHQHLVAFELDEVKNRIEVSCWMEWKWQDVHLTWKPSNYENIETILVTSADIWVPDFGIYNTVGDVSYILNDVRCRLNSTGWLDCSSHNQLAAECDVDIQEWPYDEHVCTMNVGSWSAAGEQVTIKSLRDGISKDTYVPNQNWELLNVSSDVSSFVYENETYVWIDFVYKMKSYHSGHASIIAPALVLASLTLAAYATEPTSRERLAVISINILCHCSYLTFLGVHLTHNGDMVPYIVLFYRDSFILVAMCLVTSLMSRKMVTASSTPPVWVMTLANCLLTSFPAHVILFDEHKGEVTAKVDNTIQGVMESEAWRLLGVLLDRVSFVIVLLIFIVSFLVYV